MRDRNLLSLFVGLNVALAGAFAVYLFLSNNSQPKVVSTAFPKVTNVTKVATLPAPIATNVAKATNTVAKPVVVAPTATNTTTATNVALKPVFTDKKFTWKEVESPDYLTYINSLRAIGCPEEKVRTIVLGDISELFQQKKLKISVENDQPWWKGGTSEMLMANVMQQRGQALDEERRVMIEKLLGPDAAEKERGDALL